MASLAPWEVRLCLEGPTAHRIRRVLILGIFFEQSPAPISGRGAEDSDNLEPTTSNELSPSRVETIRIYPLLPLCLSMYASCLVLFDRLFPFALAPSSTSARARDGVGSIWVRVGTGSVLDYKLGRVSGFNSGAANRFVFLGSGSLISLLNRLAVGTDGYHIRGTTATTRLFKQVSTPLSSHVHE